MGKSIETSLLGSLASNLLAAAAVRGIHSATAPVLDDTSSPHLQEHTQHTTQTGFNTHGASYHLSPCVYLSTHQIEAHGVFVSFYTACFCATSPDEPSHVCARMHL